jgi:hypothetical protein
VRGIERTCPEGSLKTFFILLSTFAIPLQTAFPQATNGTEQPQAGNPPKAAVAGSSQPWNAASPAVTEILKQKPWASNGFSLNSIQSTEQPRPQPFRPPQISPWTGPFANIGPYGSGLDLGIRGQELVGTLPNSAKVCAIPLLEVPVDGRVDKGFRLPHRSESEQLTDPKIAVPPPMPACDNHPSSQPKLKAK